MTQRRPRRIGPFVAIEWFFTGSTFTPTIRTVCVCHTRQDDPSFGCASKASFEEVNKWKANFAQFYGVNKQGPREFLRVFIMPLGKSLVSRF